VNSLTLGSLINKCLLVAEAPLYTLSQVGGVLTEEFATRVTNSLIEKLGSATTEGVLSSAGVREEMRFFSEGRGASVVYGGCLAKLQAGMEDQSHMVPWFDSLGEDSGS
jgi:hypothetical protein